MIKDYSRTLRGIVSVVLLCAIVIAASPLASAQTVVEGKYGLNFALYTDPGNGNSLSSSWQRVYDAKVAHPEVRITVAANPSNGPGGASAADYRYSISALRSVGVNVLGYVYTDYNQGRTDASVKADIDKWVSWYGDGALGAGRGITGIMFDEMTNTLGSGSNGDNVQWYKSLTTYAKSKGLTKTTGNPGADTRVEYIGSVDQLKVNEGQGYPNLNNLFNNWKKNYPITNFAIIPYSVSSLDENYVRQSQQYMSDIYIQNDGANGGNPWDSVSTYFERIVEIQGEANLAAGTSVPPAAPTGLAATATSPTQINLSWSAPTNNGGSALTGYKIDVKIGTGAWSTLVANAGTGTTYSHTGLTASTLYTYRISAINSAGTGVPSAEASATTQALPATAPAAPTGLAATATSPTQINLSWSAPTNNGGSALTGYKIDVKIGTGAWSTLVANAGTGTTYSHTGLTASTLYTYRISAINSAGTGVPSAEASATTQALPATAPAAPTGLAATATSPTQINLSWSAPTNNGGSALTGYKIDVKIGTGAWSTLVANAGTGTTYSHTGLTASTLYTYRISAINSAGTGVPSAEASATTQAITFTQATASQPTSTKTITVKSVNMAGNPITGYYTTIHQNGAIVKTGFTPLTFTGAAGATYTMTVSNYNGVNFHHWQDDSTVSSKTITLNQDTTITAFYNNISLNQGTNPTKITVKTVNSQGTQINGYYTVLSQNGNIIATAFSPATFAVSSGQSYQISVGDYNGVNFHHWDNNSNLRQRTFSINSDTTFTASYTP